MRADVWSVFGMLAAVVVILAAAYWAARWLGSYGAKQPGFRPGKLAQGRMQLLAQLPLGRGELVALVRIGERCYLLGVASGSVRLLREFDAGESLAFLPNADGESAAPSFMEALKENLRKRK